MPAPVRSTQKFPQAWGYVVGVSLIVAGIVIAVVMAVVGIGSLYSDVRDFQRNASNGELLASLERGEYYIYDEDGLDFGPGNIRVVRESDGERIGTDIVDDDVTYDVDGREGRAAASVVIPTDGLYRIEVDTSVGDVARFALGGDLVEGPGSIIGRALLVGVLFVVPGIILLLYTLVQHARWRVRTALSDRLDAARVRVADTVAPDPTTDAGAESAGPTLESARTEVASRLDQWTTRAQEAVDRARAEVDRRSPPPPPPPPPGVAAGPPPAADTLAARAAAALDRVEAGLQQASSQAAAQVAEADGSDVAGRLDETLARVQQRIDAGDSLRSIAADERVTAAEVARGTSQAAQDQVAALRVAADEAAQRANQEAADQIAAVEQQLADVAGEAEAAAAASVSEAFDALAPTAETLGDDLTATGVAAAAAGSGVLSGALGRVLGGEPTSAETDPTPEAAADAIESVVGGWTSYPEAPVDGGADMPDVAPAPAIADQPAPLAAVSDRFQAALAPPPQFEPAQPIRPPGRRATAPAPAAASALGTPATPGTPARLAPPILAPPPAAQARVLSGSPASAPRPRPQRVTAPAADAASRPRETAGTPATPEAPARLAPPILAPPPTAQARVLSGPPASAPRPRPQAVTAPAADAASATPEPEDTDHPVAARPGFSPAPPPRHSGLDRS